MLALTHHSRRRILASEVLRMLKEGTLSEEEPIELLEGRLVDVSPQGPLHSSRIMALHGWLIRCYGPEVHVRVQMPVTAGLHSLPEPDLAVVRGQPQHYAERHPAAIDTLLLIEVAHTSQPIDREKAAIYARAAYPEYWLVDLAARRVELRSQPAGDGYAALRHAVLGQQVTLPGCGTDAPVTALLD